MNVFLSTPISCFSDKEGLKMYKKSIHSLISRMKIRHKVCSEIEKIYDETDYDSPEKSIEKDLNAVKQCDLFIFHYPKKTPTSALIELGFAMSFNKKIIIITPCLNELPYLLQGIKAVFPDSQIIESASIDNKTINQILLAIDSFEIT